MTTKERFLTIAEVAELLREKEETVRRYIRTGRLPAYRPSFRLLIDAQDLEDFLAGSRRK